MTDQEAEQIVVWYGDLESRLLDFLGRIPLTKENLDTHLPLLAPVIVEAGSLIDSIFREEYTGPSATKLDIGNFAPHYEPTLKLSNLRTLVYQYPPRLLNPFKGWTSKKTGNFAKLKWWADYNKLKHNRIKQYELATLVTAVTILCALHQVIVKLPTFVTALWRHRLNSTTNYSNLLYVGQRIEKSLILAMP